MVLWNGALELLDRCNKYLTSFDLQGTIRAALPVTVVLGVSFLKSNQLSGRVMNSSNPTKGYRCNSLNVKMKETGAPEETRTPNP